MPLALPFNLLRAHTVSVVRREPRRGFVYGVLTTWGQFTTSKQRERSPFSGPETSVHRCPNAVVTSALMQWLHCTPQIWEFFFQHLHTYPHEQQWE